MGNTTLPAPQKARMEPFHCQWYHLKTTCKGAKFQIMKVSAFFFAEAGERIFIKTHSTESRFVMGPGNLLLIVIMCTFQPRNFTGWASEGLKKKKTLHSTILSNKPAWRFPPYAHKMPFKPLSQSKDKHVLGFFNDSTVSIAKNHQVLLSPKCTRQHFYHLLNITVANESTLPPPPPPPPPPGDCLLSPKDSCGSSGTQCESDCPLVLHHIYFRFGGEKACVSH